MGMCQKGVRANRGIPSIPNGAKFPRKGDDETHPCFIFEQLHIDTTANCVRNPILLRRKPPSFRSGAFSYIPMSLMSIATMPSIEPHIQI